MNFARANGKAVMQAVSGIKNALIATTKRVFPSCERYPVIIL